MRKRTADFLVRMADLHAARVREAFHTYASEYGRTPCYALTAGYIPSYYAGG